MLLTLVLVTFRSVLIFRTSGEAVGTSSSLAWRSGVLIFYTRVLHGATECRRRRDVRAQHLNSTKAHRRRVTACALFHIFVRPSFCHFLFYFLFLSSVIYSVITDYRI